MSTAEYNRRLDVPATLLGKSYQYWTKTSIQFVLDHYDWDYRAITRSKRNLMHELYLLVQEHNLTRRDRIELFNARKRGQPLPRPRVSRLTRSALQAISHQDTASPTHCVVCFEPLNIQNTLERNITSSCNHKPNICRDCLTQSISTQSESKVWDQIDCPTCRQRLTFQDVKEFADPVVFGRYENHSLQACLSRGPFQRCRHPNCQSGQQCFPEDSYIICVVCRGCTCTTCDIVWHPSETCAEIAARREEAGGAEEAATTQYITTNVKLCPRCNARGEKISGCDHMTCPQCRFQYCWVCLVDYTKIRRHGNNEHRRNCRYHSDNLPAVPRVEAIAAPATTAAPIIAAPQAVPRVEARIAAPATTTAPIIAAPQAPTLLSRLQSLFY